jgi:hypothetical protein
LPFSRSNGLSGFSENTGSTPLAATAGVTSRLPFSPLKRGRPKKHDDDPELILRVELLRCRDGLSITNACKVISETGALKGKPTTLQDRYKRLMHHPRHDWCTLLKVLRAMARDRDTYIEGLEAGSGAKIFNFTPTV